MVLVRSAILHRRGRNIPSRGGRPRKSHLRDRRRAHRQLRRHNRGSFELQRERDNARRSPLRSRDSGLILFARTSETLVSLQRRHGRCRATRHISSYGTWRMSLLKDKEIRRIPPHADLALPVFLRELEQTIRDGTDNAVYVYSNRGIYQPVASEESDSESDSGSKILECLLVGPLCDHSERQRSYRRRKRALIHFPCARDGRHLQKGDR